MRTFQQKVSGRLSWYKARFQVNNPVVGRLIELLGDRVRMDGLIYSVASPQITTGHKSTLAFGLHEMEERELIRRWMPSDVPVLEFGGGLGVVSCLANRKLREPSSHIVVEANPVMAVALESNRDLNGCKFQVVNKAIAYDCDYIDLILDAEFVSSSVKATSGRTVKVKTTTVLELMDAAGFDQAGIVCDIEGSELDLIRRELPSLGARIQFLMAEMHPAILGADVVDDLLRELKELGFVMKQQIGDSVFLSR
jgi:FkbM family methyltransferase